MLVLDDGARVFIENGFQTTVYYWILCQLLEIEEYYVVMFIIIFIVVRIERRKLVWCVCFFCPHTFQSLVCSEASSNTSESEINRSELTIN